MVLWIISSVFLTVTFQWSPLGWACDKDRASLVVLLLAHSALRETMINGKKQDALRYCQRQGNERAARALQEFDSAAFAAKKRAEEERKAAELAQQQAEEDRRRREEQARCEREEAERKGKLRLHEAVATQDMKKALEVLRKTPDLANYVDSSSGLKPIHLAASRGYTALVELLLPHCDVNSRSATGRTPLHEASHAGHLMTVQLLVSKGASLNLVNDKGETAALLACENGKTDVILYLAEREADFNIKDHRGKNCFDALKAQNELSVMQQVRAILRKRNIDKLLQAEWESFQKAHPGKYGPVRKAAAEEVAAIERIRRAVVGEDVFKATSDKWCLAEDNTFVDALLYQALAFVSMEETVDDEDILDALNAYERKAQFKSPLFVLCHAKLQARRGAAASAAALIREYQKLDGPKKWLTEEDIKPFDLASEEDSQPARRSPSSLSYDALAKNLTPSQKHPLDELMAMVGLEEVKLEAMKLYTDTLADQRLQKGGFKDSVAPRTLNFIFAGNPGTGKTVTAELFAKLLEQSGARAAYKFVKMTAGEALRKGAKQFAAEVASLTGGRKGVGPPPEQVLRKGMPVEVRTVSGNQMFPGKISHVDSDKNLYSVDYADGTVEEKIPRSRVVAIGEGKNVGGVLFLDEAYDLDPEKNSEGRAIVNEIMSVAEEFRDTVTIILAGYKDDIEKKLLAFNSGMASRFQTIHFEDFTEDQLAEIWRKNCREKKYQCGEDVTKVASRRVARGIGRKGFGNARDVRKLFETSISYAKTRFGLQDKVPTIVVEDVIGKEPSRETIPELDAALKELEGMVGLTSVKKSVEQLIATAKANYDKEKRGERIDLLTLNRLFIGNPGTGKTTVAAIYGKILKALRYLSNGDVMLRVGSDLTGDHVGEAQTRTRAILEMAQGKVLLIDEAYVLDDDLYGKQALNTIVEKVQATAGADMAVILAGYEQPMLKMLRDQNPGLSSRFDPKFALRFEDYDDEDLLKLVAGSVAKGSVHMPIQVKLHAVEQLAKRRALPNFGNARAVETLVANAKIRRQARLSEGKDLTKHFVVHDVNPDLEDQDPKRALEELRTYGNVARELEDLGRRIEFLRKEGSSLEGQVSHYIFTGAPGTGKTSVARLIARVLYAYGVLAAKNVVETSAQGLVGGYVGHTRKAVDDKMSEARGGVLFIDEAYDLGKGVYGTEAIGQLLNNLTLPEYMDGKTVVVLAGYPAEMHEMLERNPGLKSRFSSFVEFEDLSPQRCVDLVEQTLEDAQPVSFRFQDPIIARKQLEDAFTTLQSPDRPGWANGRDALEMTKKILRRRPLRILREGGDKRLVTAADIEGAIDEFLSSRPISKEPQARTHEEEHVDPRIRVADMFHLFQQQKTQQRQAKAREENRVELMEDDMLAEEALIEDQMREIEEKVKQEQDEEHQKALEEERRRLQELQRQLREAAEAERKRLLEREAKRQAVRRKLASMGICPAGFVWHREGAGFRCGGGTHFVTLAELGVRGEDLK